MNTTDRAIERHFNDLKPGDKLMIKGRSFGASGWSKEKFHMCEWKEVFVTKVTPVFYFVGDEKFRKDQLGSLGFGRRHCVPGCNGTPDESNTAEFEIKYAMYCKLIKADTLIARKLEQLPTLEQAAEFAEKYAALQAELDFAIEQSGIICGE